MREWVPVPGSAKARLIDAALYHFERSGFESCNVADLAAKAGVTTGSLYHHFGSKLGLYRVVRGDVERRIIDRMEGAAAGVGGEGRRALLTAVIVAFDAAVRFDACRLLGELPPSGHDDPVELMVRTLVPENDVVAAVVVAAWRSALVRVAEGEPAESARAALRFVMND
jgi:AcrR family transcriptional regulator